MATSLYMIETPLGGDALFANIYRAFETLSPAMQWMLEGITAIHDGEHVYRGRYNDDGDDLTWAYPRAEHPVVRTHPVSGRRALFVNRTFTTRLVELEQLESDASLELLFDHAEQPEFQCRFQWQPGSVAFWDNRFAIHHAMWDYYPNRWRGFRVTIKGEVPS